jgi:hypothetical protein
VRVVDETEAPAVRKISPLPRATKAGRSASRPLRPISTNRASFGAGAGSRRPGPRAAIVDHLLWRPLLQPAGRTAGTGSLVCRRSG